ncbi:hypothetical protein SAMN05443572_12029 [Myxococcus fulvus]|uniref:Outer membrane protein beta-barrel domain-containing protein n=1 Tax=Myxococcus fulvus TaxID=33 RepID=A0A511TGT6_MYXFU|nr:hypothetical protein [Myxococcus fulvus]GEN13385.1 hypothetical protein MFU01_84220 [Myxococcus fulvus]SEU42684.1 hypothetical protein SAMN05443572_12029 [Myxococcus fulvus]
MSRIAGWVVLVLSLVVSYGPAEAAQAKKKQAQQTKVAVLRPEGSQAEALRKVLAAELGKKGRGRVVLPAKKVDAQVKLIRGGPKTDEQRQALAKKLGADILILSSVKGTKRWDVQVRAYSGQDGSLIAEERWDVRTNRAFPDVRRELEPKLGAALKEAPEQSLPPAAVTPPTPVASEPEVAPPAPIAEAPRQAVVKPPPPAVTKEEPPAKPEPKAAGPRNLDGPTLEALLSGQGLFRRFNFSGSNANALPDYSLNSAAAASLSVSYFPLSHFTDGMIHNLGLVARGSRSFGLSTRLPDDSSHPTTAQLIEGGLRFRLPLRWLELSVGALYGTHSFSVELPPESTFALPDVDYRFAHVELGLRKALNERWAIAARVGYQHVLSGGELSSDDYLPELSGSGIDGELAVEFALTRILGLRVGGEVRSYSFTAGAAEGTPVFAGGAKDLYFSGQLGLYVRL